VRHLNETLRKSKAYYLFWRNTYFQKKIPVPTFQKILGYFRAIKLCIQGLGPNGINHPVSLKVNYRSQVLRWLASVGMFLAKRVFL